MLGPSYKGWPCAQVLFSGGETNNRFFQINQSTMNKRNQLFYV